MILPLVFSYVKSLIPKCYQSVATSQHEEIVSLTNDTQRQRLKVQTATLMFVHQAAASPPRIHPCSKPAVSWHLHSVGWRSVWCRYLRWFSPSGHTATSAAVNGTVIPIAITSEKLTSAHWGDRNLNHIFIQDNMTTNSSVLLRDLHHKASEGKFQCPYFIVPRS